jgi:hypothetical protein
VNQAERSIPATRGYRSGFTHDVQVEVWRLYSAVIECFKPIRAIIKRTDYLLPSWLGSR